MKILSTILTTLLCLSATVAAIQNTTREFHLKTRLLKPRYGRYKFNNLYVYSYHTGAGQSDAALGPTKLSNRNGVAFYNASSPTSKTGNIIFQLSADFPWGLSLTYDAQYNEWASVTIGAGPGQSDFRFNASGLVSDFDAWGGWMVCDWAHGVPQLFWRFYYADSLPRSCALVQLHLEYI
ncbi:hypothetical protein ABW19_dt0200266 [Dactylella cylindrospora]|nr:hypothetical protein ABW19_dt0200266 [Dactylella cylindrospora]